MVAIEVYGMNILDAVAISPPCHSCGGNYQVPFRDVLLSHKMLHKAVRLSKNQSVRQSSNHVCLNAVT
jgi:transposase-like protein